MHIDIRVKIFSIDKRGPLVKGNTFGYKHRKK